MHPPGIGLSWVVRFNGSWSTSRSSVYRILRRYGFSIVSARLREYRAAGTPMRSAKNGEQQSEADPKTSSVLCKGGIITDCRVMFRKLIVQEIAVN